MVPDSNLSSTVTQAERLRWAVAEMPISTPEGSIEITMSLGVTAGGGDSLAAESLVRAADAALYQAKKLGRNRVEPGSAGDGGAGGTKEVGSEEPVTD